MSDTERLAALLLQEHLMDWAEDPLRAAEEAAYRLIAAGVTLAPIRGEPEWVTAVEVEQVLDMLAETNQITPEARAAIHVAPTPPDALRVRGAEVPEGEIAEARAAVLAEVRREVEGLAEKLGRRYQVVGQDWPKPYEWVPTASVLAILDRLEQR